MALLYKKELITMLNRQNLLLYAITDRTCLKGDQTLFSAVEMALAGGATMLQLREKSLEGLGRQKYIEEARELHWMCRAYEVPLIVNDDVETAKLIDAEGVHVGQNDMPVDEVRKILGKDKIVGASAHTVEQAIHAQMLGADYLGVGAVFSTSTKKDANTISLKTLRSICNSVTIPVVAIGGITKENVAKLKGSNVSGVAVVSSIFAQEDVLTATHKLKIALRAL